MNLFLHEIFDERSIKLIPSGNTKEEVFTKLIAAIGAVHPGCDQASLLTALWEREAKLSTGIASGVAIPHVFCRDITTMAGAIGISKTGIEYNALDNKPVHIVFMLAIGEPAKENHLHILNQIFTLAQSEALTKIKNAQSVQDIHTILARFH